MNDTERHRLTELGNRIGQNEILNHKTMLSYYLKCRKNAASKNTDFKKTKKGENDAIF